MAKPIYKIFLFKPTEAWYQLSEQKKNKLAEKKLYCASPAGIRSNTWVGAWSSFPILKPFRNITRSLKT
jgi:hypothetical protein